MRWGQTEVFMTKVPQNSDELLVYTQEQIKELNINNIIHKPEEKRKCCVYCMSKVTMFPHVLICQREVSS